MASSEGQSNPSTSGDAGGDHHEDFGNEYGPPLPTQEELREMEHRRLVGEATNLMLNFSKDPKLAKYMSETAFQDKQGKKHDRKRKKSTDFPGYLGSQSAFDKAKKHKRRAAVPSSSSSSDSSSESSEEERRSKKRSKRQRHGKGKRKTRKSRSRRVDDSSTEDSSTDSSDSEDGHLCEQEELLQSQPRRVVDGKRTPSWQKFRSAIRKAFEPANADFHARSSLCRLNQTGSLAAYITEFQRLTLEIETLSPSDKLHIFIDGLEPNLKDDVNKFDPATLDAAIAYVKRLGDNRRQGRNFFPNESSFNNNRSFQRDNRGRYSQNRRSSQNYQLARQFSSRQFSGQQFSGQQSFRPRFSGQTAPSQARSSSNGFRNQERPRQDWRRDDRRNLQRDATSGQHTSSSSAPSTSQSCRQGLCTICNGDHRWYECPKRPNPSNTRRNTNMESCPETEQCSTSNPDKGKQAVRSVRVSKVISALMLNANTNVSVLVNLSNQVLSLLGFVGKHPLNVLVDSGCFNNFCNKKVQQLKFQIQDYHDQLDFSVMPLSHYDMILGQSWLYQYDPIISFRDHSIRLFHQNQEVELRGLFNTQPITMVSAMQVKRLVRKRYCTTTLVMLREAEDNTEVQSEASTTHTDYLQKPFFHQFLDLFPDELPTTLPSRRPVDHTIDLIPGQPPPVRAPYRVSYSESQEIQRQLEDY
ncbi:hypothetical protein L7F22_038180 [Adiantum nelumboides]|nr:hypothetical protein [Adiantum nelumboides]